MELYKIGYDVENNKNKNGFVTVDEKDSLKDYYKHIETDIVEMVDLTEDIIAIVDEEGLFKMRNPVYEFNVNGHKFTLVGNILLGKLEVDGYDTNIVSIDASTVSNFIKQAGVRIIGYTS